MAPPLKSPRIVGISGLVTTLERSRLMSRVRGRGNENTELRLARLLRLSGIKGWRRHLRLPGTPDFAFRVERLAVFVDGCFWHGCPKCYSAPRRNKGFWQRKVSGNRDRDVRVGRALRSRGWAVVRIWECALRNSPDATILRLIAVISKRRGVER